MQLATAVAAHRDEGGRAVVDAEVRPGRLEHGVDARGQRRHQLPDRLARLEAPRDIGMGVTRLDMAAKAGADVVVTACPFCLINLEDAIKTTGREDSMEVIDVAELVARALDDTETA